MAELGQLFSAILSIFQIEFSLYGFTLSFWNVFLWTGFAGIALWVVFAIIGGD